MSVWPCAQIYLLNADEVSSIAQIPLPRSGLYWLKSGWMAVRNFVLRELEGVIRRAERVEQIVEVGEQVRLIKKPSIW